MSAADILIGTRPYGSTYIAKVRKQPYTASCTMGERQAAEALVRKWYGANYVVEDCDEPPQFLEHHVFRARWTGGQSHD